MPESKRSKRQPKFVLECSDGLDETNKLKLNPEGGSTERIADFRGSTPVVTLSLYVGNYSH